MMYVVVMTYIWIGRSWILLYNCGTACVYFSFRWGPFVHSLGIVQWNSTRRDHPGNLGGVSGLGHVTAYHSFFVRLFCKLSSSGSSDPYHL